MKIIEIIKGVPEFSDIIRESYKYRFLSERKKNMKYCELKRKVDLINIDKDIPNWYEILLKEVCKQMRL